MMKKLTTMLLAGLVVFAGVQPGISLAEQVTTKLGAFNLVSAGATGQRMVIEPDVSLGECAREAGLANVKDNGWFVPEDRVIRDQTVLNVFGASPGDFFKTIKFVATLTSQTPAVINYWKGYYKKGNNVELFLWGDLTYLGFSSGNKRIAKPQWVQALKNMQDAAIVNANALQYLRITDAVTGKPLTTLAALRHPLHDVNVSILHKN